MCEKSRPQIDGLGKHVAELASLAGTALRMRDISYLTRGQLALRVPHTTFGESLTKIMRMLPYFTPQKCMQTA